MNHRGVEYQILQTISLSSWKWVVYFSPTVTKKGDTTSKKRAIEHAIKAIDQLKAAQERAMFKDGGSN